MFIEIAQFTIQAGKGADFAQVAGALIPEIRALDGCSDVELVRISETGDRYVMLMRWKTQEALAAFYGTGTAKKIAPIAEAFFSAPPIIDHGQVISQ